MKQDNKIFNRHKILFRYLMAIVTCLMVKPDVMMGQSQPTDIDNNGNVNMVDLTLIVKNHVSNNGSLTYSKYSYLDANADGVLDKSDISYTADYILQRIQPKAEAVDLGLSVKWATCNVGASSPNEYGYYFAWGELATKTDYSENGYLYYVNDTYQSIGSNICSTKYDVAYTKWGDGWHMPTQIDVNQLIKKCTWTATTLNGVAGYTVTGPSGNSIFLPMAGLKKTADGQISDAGTNLYYWSGMSSGSSAYCINNSGYTGLWKASRAYGMPIRPVK